jgi:Winged helix DNA-binding domain
LSWKPYELSWTQVHAFRLERHHLVHRAPAADLVKVTGAIGGAQAQLMSAAELQVGVRVDCRTSEVRDALWKDRTLVKTWLMRGTLHLIPAADLGLYTSAMRARSIKTRSSWLKFFQLSEAELMEVIAAIGEALDDRPQTREELIARVGAGRSEHVLAGLRSGWGGMLKPVARNGLLCFGPSRGQSVTFVRPERWIAGWRQLDPDEALVEVARRYLRAYGPATKQDFTRWWGTWSGVGTAAWAGLAQELVPVSIEGTLADVLESDLEAVTRQPLAASVQLLPSFDPYLMGHATRHHLVEVAHASKVSRTAGWISAVVLVDGQVAGTWTHEVVKETLRLTLAPFRRLSSKTTAEVRRRAGSLAETLGLARAEVQIA